VAIPSTSSSPLFIPEWLRNGRHSHRYAVQWLVAAKNQNDRPVALTMTDISETGIGLSSTAKFLVGDLLKLRVSAFTARIRSSSLRTRVVWTLPGNVAGAEFVNISVADSDVLHKWLQQQCHVENLGPRYTNLPLVHNLDPRLQGLGASGSSSAAPHPQWGHWLMSII